MFRTLPGAPESVEEKRRSARNVIIQYQDLMSSDEQKRYLQLTGGVYISAMFVLVTGTYSMY
jgi:hypothetical protein